jgi:DNA-binding transcriptional MocR family regulator
MDATRMNRPGTDPPLYAQVAAAVQELIDSGALRPGDRVPSIRRASRQHGVSANTVVEAYLALEDRGLIEGRPKSGFFVRSRVLAKAPSRRTERPRLVEVGNLQTRLFDAARMRDVVPFGAAYPSADVLPAVKFARITAALARQHPRESISYDMPPGSDALRREVAKRSLEAGTTLTPEEIITTCGGTEALSLAIRAVTKPGDVVAVESPTYFGLLQLLDDLRRRAIEIPMDPRNGMDLDALERTVRRERVAAVVAVPNFSNPLGSAMPEAHKARLAEVLRAREIPLIEDDINGELGHGSTRPKVVHAQDHAGLVLLCGSYSKTLAPGYRVGWIAPGRFYERVKGLKLTTTLATPSLPQMAVAEFLANGGYDHHLRSLRTLFATQVARYRAIISASFPPGTRVSEPAGGFVLWVELPARIAALPLQERALAEGISFAPGPMFSARQRFTNFLRINCAHPVDSKLEDALARLGSLAKRA